MNPGGMLMSNEQFFTVGELAKRFGVTNRTLQFYDQEGLLNPSRYSEGGRRLYSRTDIIRLQQILFFKSFGFKLQEIKDKIVLADDPEALLNMLNQQRNILSEQATKIHDVIQYLDQVLKEGHHGTQISTEKLMLIMEMMQSGNPYAFIVQYISKDHLDAVFPWRTTTHQAEKETNQAWEALFDEVISLHRGSTDPASAAGQDLARRWWAKVEETAGGDPSLIGELMDMGSDVDQWPDSVADLKAATKEFLGPAFEIYFRNNGKDGLTR
jgi:DNA-binding transcriptional MerR regulator